MKSWHLTKFYYTMDVHLNQDPNGDHMLLNFYRPTADALREKGWVDWVHFMRFSEEGYHIRMTLYAEDECIEKYIEPFIQEQVEAYRKSYPELMQTQDSLTPLAQTLNRKWGKSEIYRVRDGGEALMGKLYDVGDEAIYETQEVFVTTQKMIELACERFLDLIAAGAPIKLRQIVVRTMLIDFMENIGMSHLELYCLMYYLIQEWFEYFELDGHFDPYQQHYNENSQRYNAYFAARQGRQDSLKLLPTAIHSFYDSWLDQMLALIQSTPLIFREEGVMTSTSALRIFSFFHLAHNRMGIDIMREIYWAQVLSDVYEKQLTAEELENARQWVDAVRARAKEEERAATS